jgi:hypothetical protein
MAVRARVKLGHGFLKRKAHTAKVTGAKKLKTNDIGGGCTQPGFYWLLRLIVDGRKIKRHRI